MASKRVSHKKAVAPAGEMTSALRDARKDARQSDSVVSRRMKASIWERLSMSRPKARRMSCSPWLLLEVVVGEDGSNAREAAAAGA